MSSNDQRASVLGRALRAGLEGDAATLESVCTADVRTWSPTLSTTSLQALLDELIGTLRQAARGPAIERAPQAP